MADKITEAVHATPYPNAPGIVIAYPTFVDWMALFEPDVGEYSSERSSHEHGVRKLLDKIFSTSTGRAVCAEFNATPSFSVMILPWAFGPLDPKGRPRTQALPAPATAKGKPVLDYEGRLRCEKHKCVFGTGTGTSATTFFTPYALRYVNSKLTADEDLLHELVHASRFVRGVFFLMAVSGVGGYKNQEEFIAELVQNIYISEKNPKRLLFHYDGTPIEPTKFLDTKMTPSPVSLISALHWSQRNLWAKLARVRAAFNPVRQVDAEYNAYMWKIEHSG